MARAFRTLAILGAVALAAGCSVKETPTPDLAGPSELALSLNLSATPDTINQDGSSQTLVVVIARDSAGRAVAGLPLRFDISKDGMIQDYGALSAKTVTTSADGRASTLYTAPAAPLDSPSPSGTPSTVSVLATPVGTNYANMEPRSVDIKLVPPGLATPPGYGPVAEFTGWEPANIWGAGLPVYLDASRSSSPAGLVSFEWEFGDGTTGSGLSVRHTYALGGTYYVRLTVTDRDGKTAWTTRPVRVATGPTALFSFTPSAPLVGISVNFYGGDSWPVPPATIATYGWDFGDGTTATGADLRTVSHTYLVMGSYTVRLVVTDTNGFKGQATQVVTVR